MIRIVAQKKHPKMNYCPSLSRLKTQGHRPRLNLSACCRSIAASRPYYPLNIISLLQSSSHEGLNTELPHLRSQGLQEHVHFVSPPPKRLRTCLRLDRTKPETDCQCSTASRLGCFVDHSVRGNTYIPNQAPLRPPRDILLMGNKQLGFPNLPPTPPTNEQLEGDEKMMQELHTLLLETQITEGSLVCGNCGHEYKIKEGIANFLLPNHLV